MLTQFKKKRNEIKQCREQGKNKNGIELCFEFIEILQKLKNKDTREDLYFCYFMLAKMNKNEYGVSKLNFSLEYIKKSIKYCGGINNDNFIRSQWLLAECYILMNNEKKALVIYNNCNNYYKSKIRKNKKVKSYDIDVDNEYRVLVLFNIGKVLKNSKSLEQLIKYYTKQKYIDVACLNEMYKDLFNIYLHSNIFKANSLLHNIKDTELSNELRLKLRAIA